MGFTKPQQGRYRKLVESAWQTHARREALDPKSAPLRRAWYEDQLRTCVGYSSTVPCDQSRDFDVAIAHFEYLADNGETYWQQRAQAGDIRRILHIVFPGNAPRIIAGQTIDAAYCLAIAEQMYQTEFPGGLRTLRKDQIKEIIRRLMIHKKRHAAR